MLESIITISITGFIAGIVFAMPIAGPISILVTSNALKGRLKYTQMISVGAALSDFVYIFIAVYGVTRFFHLFRPVMMYLYLVGAVFFIILGYRLFIKPVDIETFEEKSHLTDKIRERYHGAFYTGMMVNFLNPTVFVSGLTSSFFVISLIASLGLNTGGLEMQLDNNVRQMNGNESGYFANSNAHDHLREPEEKPVKPYPRSFHLVISICYALFISLGNVTWFFLFSYLLVRYRKLINVKVLRWLIRSFGIILSLIGLYFGYLGVTSINWSSLFAMT